jgi:hypothetical protein
LYYLYFKKNQKEPFVYDNYNTNVDISAGNFLSEKINPATYNIEAPYNNDNIKITSLIRAVDFALSDKSKSFSSSQGKPTLFPINTIVKNDCEAKVAADDNAVPCMYKPHSVAFGYGSLPIERAKSDIITNDIRYDNSANIYLDNYDQIDKIIEREKIDKNYIQKTLDQYPDDSTFENAKLDGTVLTKDEIYKLRDENNTNINRRGAVEVAYSRKEELNNTKNKYNTENIRNNSINLQYIFLFCVILASIIVLGLYYISFISNSVLIIYIILVILVIYFFNIINIIN